MPGEICTDEAVSAANPSKKYETEVYNMVMDSIVNDIERRMEKPSIFFSDMSLLHPRNFAELPSCVGAMEELSRHIKRFDVDATPEQLGRELRSFAEQWPTLRLSIGEEYSGCSGQMSDNESDEEMQCPDSTVSCRNCPICCYKVLHDLRLFTDSYKTVGLAYKLLLTLPVSQVACERSFSFLKRIKTRLRSTMTQDHLEAFMLMSTEKSVLSKISNEKIIDGVASSSKELHRLLAL